MTPLHPTVDLLILSNAVKSLRFWEFAIPHNAIALTDGTIVIPLSEFQIGTQESPDSIFAVDFNDIRDVLNKTQEAVRDQKVKIHLCRGPVSRYDEHGFSWTNGGPIANVEIEPGTLHDHFCHFHAAIWFPMARRILNEEISETSETSAVA